MANCKSIHLYWRLHSLLLALLCFAVLLPAHAQRLPNAAELLEQQRRAEQQRQAEKPTEAQPLAPPRPGAAPAGANTDNNAGPSFTVQRFDITGSSLVPQAELQLSLQPWLNRPLTLAELRNAAAALEARYRAAGWLAQVGIPAQDVTEGLVRLQVTEAQLGAVQVLGSTQLAPRLVQQAQALVGTYAPTGQALNLAALEQALLLADELPGLRAAGSLKAGAAAGSTDVALQLASTPMLRGDISLDNGGAEATGAARISARAALDSPWGLGERLEANLAKTSGSDYVHGAASLPLGARGLRVGAHISALNYRVRDARNNTPGLAPRGSSRSSGASLVLPLHRSSQMKLDINAGIERLEQHNEDDVQNPDTLQTTSRSRHRLLNLGAEGHRFDELGLGGLTRASVQLGLGRLDLNGSPPLLVAGDAQGAATQGSFQRMRYSVSRQQTLSPRLSLTASLSGQFANKNLDAAQRFYLGGPGGVNAYPTGEAGGSAGHLLKLELRQQLAANWQASALVDVGRVRKYVNTDRADGTGPIDPQTHVTLKGVGASLSWQPMAGMQVSAVWAHRVGTNPLATPSGTDTDGSLKKNRVWLSASVSF